MSDKSNEQISQLMDGELEINASRFLLKRLATDESLSSKWDGYHLIKSCLQKQADEPLVFDVARQVRLRLESEQIDIDQPEMTTSNSSMQRWLKPLLGAGIAASVAIMSVFMLQNQQTEAVSVKPLVNVANDIQPMKTPISANVATSGKSILPPVSLSRFPSANSNNLIKNNQGFSHNVNMPYLIINQKPESTPYSPIRIQDISD